ncbi:hypothetical protein ACFWJ8_13120, partial [Microbacterium sp. NPDC058389]
PPWPSPRRGGGGRAPPPPATGPGYGDAVPLAAAAAGGAPYGDDASVADWRARQEAWRAENDAWRRSRQDADRAARDQARRERHAHGAAFALEAEDRRRIRRATRPRTSFVFVLTALGAAIVVGAVAVLISLGDAATAPFAGAIGIFTAALVTALAMVVAGAIRRRSGFLTAVTIVLLVIGGSAVAASGRDHFVVGGINLGTASYEQRVTQPAGDMLITVGSLSDTEDFEAGGVVVRKGFGATTIELYPGTALVLEAELGDGGVRYDRIDGSTGRLLKSGTLKPGDDGVWRVQASSKDAETGVTTTQHIVLDQSAGSVQITIYEK